ncbi:hypothetical protein [Glycomyces harbinensis]|uniref:Uncharacterized protein n=1 Tax=Glycomyces harbinensis TaxID=58114 RepID=A0A1G7ASZ0_9ACTN|nr:hypothetical protein [Glycomyces harbinensis]SDE17832.1 hypothetical protein SAMN05216270_114129 [Glycomyces harbinensis]
MMWFGRSRQVSDLRREVLVLVKEQQRTNDLLAEILEHQRESEADRDIEPSLLRSNFHLAHGAVMLAGASVAVAIVALVAGLPFSWLKLVAVLCAGIATLVLLVGAASQYLQGGAALRRGRGAEGKRR